MPFSLSSWSCCSFLFLEGYFIFSTMNTSAIFYPFKASSRKVTFLFFLTVLFFFFSFTSTKISSLIYCCSMKMGSELKNFELRVSRGFPFIGVLAVVLPLSELDLLSIPILITLLLGVKLCFMLLSKQF